MRVCCKRSDAVYKTFLYEVITEIHVIFLRNGERNVYWTRPVTLRNHFQHHQIAFVKSVLSFERNDHTVGYCVAGHHHSTTFYSLFINGYVNRIGRNEVHIATF